MDISELSGYQIVTLIDRAAKGGFEFMYGGIVFGFPPGEVELAVPAAVGEFVFKTEKCRVRTLDGRFVHRVAARSTPNVMRRLREQCGDEVADDSLIEIDTGAAEGWDTSVAVERVGKPTKVVQPVLGAEERRELQEAQMLKRQAEDIIKRIEDHGADVDTSTPEQFGQLVKTEVSKWTAVVQKAKIKPD